MTAGLFAAQVASRPTTFLETSRPPPGTAVLLLNTRSRPTWLSATRIDDGPKKPDTAWLPVTTRSRPIVSGCWPLARQLLPSPIPRLTVLSVIRRSRPTVRLQKPSNTNGKPGDPSITTSWPTLTGPPGVFGELCPVCTVCGFEANRSCPIVTLSRCVPPPRPSSCMSCPIVDRRMSAPDSSPRPTKSCPIDESVMPAPESVPPATMSCPTVDSEMSAPAKSPKVRSLPMLVLTISAPASSRWIMSCVIVASVTAQKPPCGTIRS